MKARVVLAILLFAGTASADRPKATIASEPATVADWPEPDRSPPPFMAERLSLGVQTGYGSPFGPLALDAGWYPTSWFGLEGTLGLHVGDEPTTAGESMRFGWRLGDVVEQGLGIGLAQSFVTRVAAGGHEGVVNYLTADCGHVAFWLTRGLALRLSIDLAFPITGVTFCEQHPEACPNTTAVSGSAALLWSFDLSHGQD